MSSRSYVLQIMLWHQSHKSIHYRILLNFQNKKTTDLRVKTWGGGIKSMLSPPLPCQNMGGIYHPIPPPGFTLLTNSDYALNVLQKPRSINDNGY